MMGMCSYPLGAAPRYVESISTHWIRDAAQCVLVPPQYVHATSVLCNRRACVILSRPSDRMHGAAPCSCSGAHRHVPRALGPMRLLLS